MFIEHLFGYGRFSNSVDGNLMNISVSKTVEFPLVEFPYGGPEGCCDDAME
jgi:hypothetical protein